MIQAQLLKTIEAVLPKQQSLIDAVAMALDLSYDAAHRRTSLKSKLSLEESVRLAQYFNVSIDRLFALVKEDYITVEKTNQIQNAQELKAYFDTSVASLQPLLNQKDSKIIYSAKDIPLFYTIGSDLLSRFKIYVWLKLLDNDFTNVNFEHFVPGIDLLESASALSQLYQNLNTTEIWDITTVNSTLKQIHFYNQAGLVSNENALKLCDALKTLIQDIHNRVLYTDNYNLYYNELLLMNNNVLVITPQQQSLYVPFSLLSYYSTSDRHTCMEAENDMLQQLQHSKLLNTSGEKTQRTFFNKIHSKINALKQLIEAVHILDFE